MKCLVLEDDLPLARVVSRILTVLGHTVAQADSLAAAQQVLASDCFDLVISDFTLPDGTADALFDIVQCLHPTPRLLVMTGSEAFPNGAAAVQAMGIERVLPKPFSRHDLAEAIGHVHRAF